MLETLELSPESNVDTVFDMFGSLPRLVLWKLYELCRAAGRNGRYGEVSFSELAYALVDVVPRDSVSKSLDVLLDCGLIYPCYRVRELDLDGERQKWLVRAYGVGQFTRYHHVRWKDPKRMLFRGLAANIQRVAPRRLSLVSCRKEAALAQSVYALNVLFGEFATGSGARGLRFAQAYKLAANYLLDPKHSPNVDTIWRVVRGQYGPIPIYDSFDEPPKEEKIKDAWCAFALPIETGRIIPVGREEATHHGALRSDEEVYASSIGQSYLSLISKTLVKNATEAEVVQLLNALVSCRDTTATANSCHFEYTNLMGWQRGLSTACEALFCGTKPTASELGRLLNFASRPRNFYRLSLEAQHDDKSRQQDFCETRWFDKLLRDVANVKGGPENEERLWSEIAAFSALQCWRAADQIGEKVRLFRSVVPAAAHASRGIEGSVWIRPIIPLSGKERDRIDPMLSQLVDRANDVKQWLEAAAYLLSHLAIRDEAVREAIQELVSRFGGRQYVGSILAIKNRTEAAERLRILWTTYGSNIQDTFDALWV